MTDPEIGAYTLWDYDNGIFPDDETIKSGFLEKKSIYVAGMITRQSPVQPKSIRLAQIDYRGRQVWDRIYPLENLLEVHTVARHPEGMAVLATVGKKNIKQEIVKAGLWFGVFDMQDGTLIYSSPIGSLKDEQRRIVGVDMKALPDKTGFIVLGYKLDNRNHETTLAYLIDNDANAKLQRAYSSGTYSRPNALVMGDALMVYMIGKAADAYDRSVGWVAGLDYKLRMMWEKSYPRGLNSELQHAALMDDGEGLIIAGWSESSDKEKRAAWVMNVGAYDGSVRWERYYRGDREYEASAVLWHDNTMSVALNGSKHPDIDTLSRDNSLRYAYGPYIRLLTMNDRGDVIFSEDYMNAQSVQVSDMITGVNNFRVLLGTTRSADPLLLADAINKDKAVTLNSFVSANAWAIAIPAASKYDDPCER